MASSILISICIPAYRRIESLRRLIDSIEMQTFRSFEVVITDDSPDGEVRELVEHHPLNGKIRYFKNPKTLGSPENWNEGIRRANGDWIKIMHDDDWFSGPGSLRQFAEFAENQAGEFFFSGYKNVYPDGHSKTIRLHTFWLKRLKRLPEILLAENRIGPPSVVIFKKDPDILFDNRMQWLVDMDFYIRYLKKHSDPVYIPHTLVQIGISGSQVTQKSFGNPDIEIPERFWLGEKADPASVHHKVIFDSWWRFLRNLSIRDISQIEKSRYDGKIPDFIPGMINKQSKIPKSLLRMGLISKFIMFSYYLKVRKSLRH
jgi:glycosyltransferase involved in cell wall biosynthesis